VSQIVNKGTALEAYRKVKPKNAPIERQNTMNDEFCVVDAPGEGINALNPYEMEPITSKVTIKGDLENIAQSLPWA